MALTLDGTSGLVLPTWTTAGRPSNPQTGQFGFNTTLGYIEWYNSTLSNWQPLNSPSSAISQASTSGTNIDFTGIPNWVKRITVMFNGVSTNGTSNLQIQLGTSSGIETSGYAGTVFVSEATAVGSGNFSTGFLVDGTTLAADIRTGSATFVLFSTNLWVGTGIFGLTNKGRYSSFTGTKTTASTPDRIRVTTANGTDTFDAGSINIMYE